MYPTETNNSDASQNNVDTSQNYPVNLVTLKNDDGSPVTNENFSLNKIMNTINRQPSKPIKNPHVAKRPRETDEEILNFFLYQFKCDQCQLKKGACQDKSTCEGWHHEGERRRNPGKGPNFLYSEEPCPKLKLPGANKWSKPTNCKDGDKCSFSHTLMEQMYHPNIYKTSLCTNFTASSGDQCQWGYFCTHAHGQKDIRNANKKNVPKRPPPNNKQKQLKNRTQGSETPNDQSQQTSKPVPKAFQNSPISATNEDHENNNYSNQQMNVSQHNSANSSSSRPFSSSYQATTVNVNGTNNKYSLPSNGFLGTQSSKPFRLSLPSTLPYSHKQTLTPNNNANRQQFYAASQSFPERFHQERQQQYSWNVNSDDVSNDVSNLQQASFPSDNIENSQLPPMSITLDEMYDPDNDDTVDPRNDIGNMDNMYNANPMTNGNPMNNINNNTNGISPNHISQTFTSGNSIPAHSPSQKPPQISRPHTLNIMQTNSKLQVVIPSTQPNMNPFSRHMTPPSTIGHAPRYPPTTSTYQTYTPQTQNVDMSAMLTQRYGNVNMWPPSSQNGLTGSFNRKPLQPIQGHASPGSSTSSQHNVGDQNISHDFEGKEQKNDVAFYFFGEDSNRPDGLEKTPPLKNLVHLTTEKQNESAIVSQLKAELDALKKELECQKEKNNYYQQNEGKNVESPMLNTEKKQDIKQSKHDFDESKEKIALLDKLITCPGCNIQKGASRNHVLIPCGHLVCEECVPPKGKACPICKLTTNESPQKISV